MSGRSFPLLSLYLDFAVTPMRYVYMRLTGKQQAILREGKVVYKHT